MTDIVEDFLIEWFWYSVAWSRFGDACRELTDLEPEEASPTERQALVDETCRLAVIVSDESEPMLELGQKVIDDLEKHDRDDDFLNAVAQIINTIQSCHERADSYLKEIANLRVGGQPRTPRRPRVANPYLPVIRSRMEALDGTIVDPGRIREFETDEEEIEEDVIDEEEEIDEDSDDNSEEDGQITEEESSDESEDTSTNPLADETEQILSGPGSSSNEEEESESSETESRVMGRNRRSILAHVRGRRKKQKDEGDGDE